MLSAHLQGCFCLSSSSPHKKRNLPFPFSDEHVCSNVSLLKRVSELEHRCPCWTGQENQERAQTAPLGSIRDLNHFNSAVKYILALIPPQITRQTNTQSPSWVPWLYGTFHMGRSLLPGLGAVPYKLFHSQRNECRTLNQEDGGENNILAFAFYWIALIAMGISAERWKPSSVSDRRFFQSEVQWDLSLFI